jgi:hypothetical protein
MLQKLQKKSFDDAYKVPHERRSRRRVSVSGWQNPRAPVPHHDVASANTARWPARNAFLGRKGIIDEAVLREMNREGMAVWPSPSVNLASKSNAMRCASTSILHV